MTKSLIVYFTQGGTTGRVAEAVAVGLRGRGHQVDLHNMSDGHPPGPGGYDALGIGSPVYIYRPPFKMMEYIHDLPELKGLPVFVFIQYGTLPGDAGSMVRNSLIRKGGREVGFLETRGADYYLGYLKRGYLFSPDNPTALELDSARAFGGDIADRIVKGDYARQGHDSPPPLVYRIERFLTGKWLVRSIYSRLFFVKSKKCTSCGLCMKICPVGNITENKDGHPVWGRSCLFCFYCEMKCPADAIVSPASWPVFTPFNVYNIWRALRDPSVQYARVVHGKGRTRRV